MDRLCPLLPALFNQRLIATQDEDGNYGLPEDEVMTIKQELIGLMTSVPPNIQSQLGEAIGCIADSDFWERWSTLVDVSKAGTACIEAINSHHEGPRFAPVAGQCCGKPRGPPSCTFNFQTMASFNAFR